jgi:metallo-beta-lactamase family protein
MAISVKFCGAAGTVTGSRYLIETDRYKFLVDCGLFQGQKELRLRNWDAPPFNISEIDAVILTHAHIDHTGYLPRIVTMGYSGEIYCTPATKDLAKLLLPDSGRLQEEEARYANIHGTSKHKPAKPLYTEHDAEQTLPFLRPIPKNTFSEIRPGVRVKPSDAGHILGASCLTIEIDGTRLTFSGDIGRYDDPLLPDPQPVEIGDLLVCESTYGNRDHPELPTADILARVIKEAVQRGGGIFIPAFAVGRTQEILYHLHELDIDGRIPPLPVYVDSPMAVDATKIYRDHREDLNPEAFSRVDKINTPRAIFCRTTEESKRLNSLKGPRIIISASGMITGGRILHHMMHGLPDEQNTVLFVGYQAKETRGDIILSGAPSVKIYGSRVPIRAKIEQIASLSAHGDRNELIRWLKSCKGSPSITRITHGEPEAATAFSTLVEESLGWKARPAEHLEVVEI